MIIFRDAEHDVQMTGIGDLISSEQKGYFIHCYCNEHAIQDTELFIDKEPWHT